MLCGKQGNERPVSKARRLKNDESIQNFAMSERVSQAAASVPKISSSSFGNYSIQPKMAYF
jgi:hypothetical protein